MPCGCGARACRSSPSTRRIDARSDRERHDRRRERPRAADTTAPRRRIPVCALVPPRAPIEGRRPAPRHCVADLAHGPIGARAAVFALLDRDGGEVTVVERAATRSSCGACGRPPRAAPLAATVAGPPSWRVPADPDSGSVGLGESYADGWWDADDLTALLRVLDRNVRRTDPRCAGPPPAQRPRSPIPSAASAARTSAATSDDVRAHYDLGNDFFDRLLDETMMYSSAVFPTPTTSLAEASVHKLDLLCQPHRPRSRRPRPRDRHRLGWVRRPRRPELRVPSRHDARSRIAQFEYATRSRPRRRARGSDHRPRP